MPPAAARPRNGRWAATMMGLLILVLVGCSSGVGSEPVAAQDPAAREAPTPHAEDPHEEEQETPGSVEAEQAAGMTIAEVLRTDDRFTRLRDIAARTEATIGGRPTTWLDIWDSEAHLVGIDREGVTVFAPTDAAFDELDPAILAVIDDPDVDNALLRTLLGAHYIHSLYPTAAFESGPHRVSRGTADPVELTLDPLAWGGHPIEHPDLRTANGYIHIIGGVVIPHDVATATGVSANDR